jgi:thiol-disulfide isomerase/thioredoxin
MFSKNTNQNSGIMSFLKNINWKISGLVLFVVGLIIISYFMFNSFNKEKNTPSVSHQSSGGKEAEIILFYVDWCPHCKTAKPEWEQVKSEYQGKTINGYTIVFTEINCTNESPEVEKLINNYKIEGYPTIKLLKDGQVIEYDAKPSKATLIQFLNTVL